MFSLNYRPMAGSGHCFAAWRGWSWLPSARVMMITYHRQLARSGRCSAAWRGWSWLPSARVMITVIMITYHRQLTRMVTLLLPDEGDHDCRQLERSGHSAAAWRRRSWLPSAGEKWSLFSCLTRVIMTTVSWREVVAVLLPDEGDHDYRKLARSGRCAAAWRRWR